MNGYRMRHGVVGVGADVVDVAEKATAGYAGPVAPDYTVLIWREGEWVERG